MSKVKVLPIRRVEVFIAYDPAVDSIHQLGQTLTAWDTTLYEPIALEVKDAKRERLSNVAAEGLSKADYIVAALGTTPASTEGVVFYRKGHGPIKVEACPERIQ